MLFTGVHNATMQEQLEGFSFALKKTINSPVDNAVSKKWVPAFHTLEASPSPNVSGTANAAANDTKSRIPWGGFKVKIFESFLGKFFENKWVRQ